MNKENKTLPVPSQRKKIDPEKFLKRAALLKKNYQEEQGKPQDICQTHLHSSHKDIPEDVYCNHCEQPQSDNDSDSGIKEEDWEKWITVLMQDNPNERMQAAMNGGYPISKESKVINYIKHNFIAKRDLRKLLEEKVIEYGYGKREIIDDLLAEIEKL